MVCDGVSARTTEMQMDNQIQAALADRIPIPSVPKLRALTTHRRPAMHVLLPQFSEIKQVGYHLVKQVYIATPKCGQSIPCDTNRRNSNGIGKDFTTHSLYSPQTGQIPQSQIDSFHSLTWPYNQGVFLAGWRS